MTTDALKPVEGAKRERLVNAAKREREYDVLHEYFKESRSLDEKDTEVYEVDDGVHVVNLNYGNDELGTFATIAFTFEEESVVNSRASIDYYHEGSLTSFDVLELDGSGIHYQNNSA